MDVPALTGTGSDRAAVEGRVEAVRDGAAKVRLSGGGVLDVAVDREFAPGTRVSVWTDSNGSVKISPLGPDQEQAALRADLLRTLEPLLGMDLSSELSAPLARGDFAAAAHSLPPSSPPQVGDGASAAPAPRPVFLSAPSPTAPPVGDVRVAVTAKLDAHTYAAEVAGRPWTLLGPSDVDPSTRLVSRVQPLPAGGAVWLPSELRFGQAVELPARIQAGPEGAGELLRWTGVQDATPQEVEDLGQALARAAASLLEEEPLAREPPTPASPLQDSPELAFAADPVAPSKAVPVPAKEPGVSAPASWDPASAQPVERAKNASTSVEAAHSDATVPPSPQTGAAQGRISSELAVRVLAAWSLELPVQDAVEKAVLNRSVAEVPQALDALDRLVQEHPGRHLALESALNEVRQSRHLPAANASTEPRRVLESAVLESLSREPVESRDRETLREAARSLLSDRLPEPSTDGGARASWTQTPSGAWNKARIVVRDERDRRGAGAFRPDIHAVEIAMDPAGLGRVEARLELRGQVLTTRLSATEPATVESIRKGLPELREALRSLGMEPGEMDVRPAIPVATASPRRRGAGGALDVRA